MIRRLINRARDTREGLNVAVAATAELAVAKAAMVGAGWRRVDRPLGDDIVDLAVAWADAERRNAAAAALHQPVDEDAEVWVDGPGEDTHAEMFPDCVDCDGHTVTIPVCRECGYGHDGEIPIYRAWPCPTARALGGKS